LRSADRPIDPRLFLPQQLRQLGDIRRDPPRIISSLMAFGAKQLDIVRLLAS